uniref:Uncharacterized protein n=1 Tax=Ixodes ricinus TaxID=34613 RepID=A0A6B0UKB8_IXORI
MVCWRAMLIVCGGKCRWYVRGDVDSTSGVMLMLCEKAMLTACRGQWRRFVGGNVHGTSGTMSTAFREKTKHCRCNAGGTSGRRHRRHRCLGGGAGLTPWPCRRRLAPPWCQRS